MHEILHLQTGDISLGVNRDRYAVLLGLVGGVQVNLNHIVVSVDLVDQNDIGAPVGVFCLPVVGLIGPMPLV